MRLCERLPPVLSIKLEGLARLFSCVQTFVWVIVMSLPVCAPYQHGVGDSLLQQADLLIDHPIAQVNARQQTELEELGRTILCFVMYNLNNPSTNSLYDPSL